MDKLDKSKLSFVRSFVFVIALFTCAAAISMGLYMSINERVKDINEYKSSVRMNL